MSPPRKIRKTGDIDVKPPDKVLCFAVRGVSKLDKNGKFSKKVEVGGMPWRVYVCRERDEGGDILCAYLECMDNQSTLWSIGAKHVHTLVNSDTNKNIVISHGSTNFEQPVISCGGDLINWRYLVDEDKGFIKDDQIIVEIRIWIIKTKGIRMNSKIDFTDPDDPSHDVALVIGKEKIYVSKHMLSAHSPVFYLTFYGEGAEKDMNEFELKDIDRKAFLKMLRVIYHPTDRKITEDRVNSFLMLGHRFKFKLVLDMAEEYLKSSSARKLASKLLLSDQYRLIKLQDFCIKKLKKVEEVKKVKDEPEYKHMSDRMKAILFERMCQLMDDSDGDFFSITDMDESSQSTNDTANLSPEYIEILNGHARKIGGSEVSQEDMTSFDNAIIQLTANNCERLSKLIAHLCTESSSNDCKYLVECTFLFFRILGVSTVEKEANEARQSYLSALLDHLFTRRVHSEAFVDLCSLFTEQSSKMTVEQLKSVLDTVTTKVKTTEETTINEQWSECISIIIRRLLKPVDGGNNTGAKRASFLLDLWLREAKNNGTYAAVVAIIEAVAQIDFNDPDDPRHNVALLIEGEKIYASKQILAIHSPVFKNIFFGEYMEKNRKEIELKDIDREGFLEMLSVIYDPTLSDRKITDDNVTYFLKLGDLYQIKLILDLAEEHLISSDYPALAPSLLLSDQYRLIKLQDHCLKLLESPREINEVKKSSEYREMSDRTRVALLERWSRVEDDE